MTYKLTCPGCDRYLSSIFHAYANGEDCPQCGSSLSAASEQYYRQLPDDHRWQNFNPQWKVTAPGSFTLQREEMELPVTEHNRLAEMLDGLADGITYTIYQDAEHTQPLAVVLPWEQYRELMREKGTDVQADQ